VAAAVVVVVVVSSSDSSSSSSSSSSSTCRAMAYVARRWLLSPESRIHSRVALYYIFVMEEMTLEHIFLPASFISPF
jgi:hypothetical protein